MPNLMNPHAAMEGIGAMLGAMFESVNTRLQQADMMEAKLALLEKEQEAAKAEPPKKAESPS